MKQVWRIFLIVAAVTGLAGMAMGIFMGITQDFALAPVHAHLNLVGWVSMAIFGLFYRAFPAVADGLLPKLHLTASVLGCLTFLPGLALMFLVSHAFMPLVAGGAMLTITGFVFFTVNVIRAVRSA